jgi:hypothetical protein
VFVTNIPNPMMPGMPFSVLFFFVTNIPNLMMLVDQQLAEYRNAILNVFVTNILNSVMMSGMPFSMLFFWLQISRIR